jgi:hypothetical protein
MYADIRTASADHPFDCQDPVPWDWRPEVELLGPGEI